MAIQSASKPLSTKAPSVLQREQDRFYQDKLGLMLLLIALLAAITGLLIFLLLALQPLRNPPPVFFKASANGELIQELPLDQANITPNVLFNWLVQGMISAHSFNFVNYSSRLEAAREYFTPEGYDSFTRALAEAKILEHMLAEKYVFRGMPTAAPQIIKEGVLANRYLWKVKFPMNFQYRNVSGSLFDVADLSILLVRVPTSESPYGVKILQYELGIKTAGGR